jgi:hypothetical protein
VSGELLRHPQTAALGWALLHSLWQIALVAGMLASVNVFLRRGSAQARYVAAAGALVLMVALPAGTFMAISPVAPEAWREALPRLCRRMRRPVVLLPASTLAGLSPAQLEALLAHPAVRRGPSAPRQRARARGRRGGPR